MKKILVVFTSLILLSICACGQKALEEKYTFSIPPGWSEYFEDDVIFAVEYDPNNGTNAASIEISDLKQLVTQSEKSTLKDLALKHSQRATNSMELYDTTNLASAGAIEDYDLINEAYFFYGVLDSTTDYHYIYFRIKNDFFVIEIGAYNSDSVTEAVIDAWMYIFETVIKN